MSLDAEHSPTSSEEPVEPSPDPNHSSAGGDTDDVAGSEDAADRNAKTTRRRGGSTAMLSAAMLAVGEILEPEKTTVEIVQTDHEPLDDLPFGIDFGDLPPLD